MEDIIDETNNELNMAETFDINEDQAELLAGFFASFGDTTFEQGIELTGIFIKRLKRKHPEKFDELKKIIKTISEYPDDVIKDIIMDFMAFGFPLNDPQRILHSTSEERRPAVFFKLLLANLQQLNEQ